MKTDFKQPLSCLSRYHWHRTSYHHWFGVYHFEIRTEDRISRKEILPHVGKLSSHSKLQNPFSWPLVHIGMSTVYQLITQVFVSHHGSYEVT